MVKNARYIVLRINIIISSIFDGYETFIKAHIFSKTLQFFIFYDFDLKWLSVTSNDQWWPWGHFFLKFWRQNCHIRI